MALDFSLRKANKEFQEKIKKQEDELNRFAEVENLKNLKYAELSKVNEYVNDLIKKRESKAKDPLPTPKIQNSQQPKPVDRNPKIR